MTAPNKPTNDSASTSREDGDLEQILLRFASIFQITSADTIFATADEFETRVRADLDVTLAAINRIRQADRQELIARVEALIGKDIDRAEFDSGGDVNEEWKYSDDYTVNAYDFIRGYNIRAKEIRAALTQLKGEKDS